MAGKEIVDFLVKLVIKASDASIDEIEVRDEISSYILETREYSIISNIVSNEKFEIASKYLLDDFIDDVRDRAFLKKSEDRQAARQAIVNKCIDRIKPKSNSEKQVVYDYVINAIDIVRNYYKRNMPTWAKIQTEVLMDAFNDRIDKLERNIISDTSINSVKTQKQIEDDIGRILHNASYDHPLKQYYKANFKNGKLFSDPISDEAIKKYPPNIKIKGKVKIDNKYIDCSSFNLLNYSYNHQKEFVIEVTDAENFLGEVKDVYQNEAKEFIGRDLTFFPEKFPPAIPCSINVDDKTHFEYVLFGVTEILDDKTYVIDNSKQNLDFYFEIKTKFIKNSQSYFNFKIINKSNINTLKIKEFIKAVEEGNRIIIKSLETGEPVISSKAEITTETTCWETIDEEIKFLKSLCAVEEWFDVDIFVPDELFGKDINAIMELGSIIMGHNLDRTWDKFKINFTYSKELGDTLNNINVSSREFLLKTIMPYNILGNEYHIPVFVKYQDGYIDNFPKVMKIVENLDDGDSFSLVLKSGNNNKCTISLCNEEKNELVDNELMISENTRN